MAAETGRMQSFAGSINERRKQCFTKPKAVSPLSAISCQLAAAFRIREHITLEEIPDFTVAKLKVSRNL